jgi:hypothetical protein
VEERAVSLGIQEYVWMITRIKWGRGVGEDPHTFDLGRRYQDDE